MLDKTARAAFDAMKEGITIIDTEGRVVFGNQAYLNFLRRDLGRDVGNIEGRLLRELRPGARLPDVLKSGQPMVHVTRKEIEDFYFVNMYPIYEDGVLVGGISVVTFIEDAYLFRDELEKYEQRHREVLRRINKANGAHYTFDDIVAVAPSSAAVKQLAKMIAATDATVLLESESGTGKELYAQAIHNGSPRAHNVFVAINCAGLNANMLESELFGYVEGAFTGAKKGGKIGLFEAANGGTLFLDEVSEIDLGLQAKLLRALQERRVRPIGAVKEVEVDVRVIAACNADLEQYVSEGKFRKDLYYRLNTFTIHTPPLRERYEDIPPLAEAILGELSRKLRRPVTLESDSIEILQAHDWPGNVRELRNVLESSAYLAQDGVITRESFPPHITHRADGTERMPLSRRVKLFEKREIQKLLARNGSTLAGKKKTAAELGISLASLYNKLAAE